MFKNDITSNLNLENFNMNDTHALTFFNNLKWLNSKQASIYVNTSVGSIRNFVYRGQLSAMKLGNRLRIKKTDLDFLLVDSKLQRRSK
jgi:excisionase family DNA binding protein